MRVNLYQYLRFNFCLSLLLFFSSITALHAQVSDSVFFRDDFDRITLGDFWQAHESWSIVNGTAFNFIDGYGGILKTTAHYPEASYVIEASAMGFTTSRYREFSITFGQENLSDYRFYQLRYTGYYGGRLTLYSSDNTSSTLLDEVAVYPGFNSTGWYKFKIAKYKSGLIQVYLDEGSGYSTTPLLEAIDLSYADLGHVGWQVDTETSGESFYVDWISATRPVEEKPAIREKPVEDDLITQVSAKSGRSYKVAKLLPGEKQLIDREYTITSVPEYLNGASFIQTANDDKLYTTDSFLTFFVKRSAIVYVAFDPRGTAVPGWLSTWHKTGDSIAITDEKVGYLTVYSKLVEGLGELYPYPIVLGGNLAKPSRGAKTNYLVAAVERPVSPNLQAEDALLSGVVAANDHKGYNGTGFADFKHLSKDYIEWTVQINAPGTYSLGFKFANAGLTPRSLRISHNGTDIGDATFSPISSIWDAWAFLSGLNVFFSSGVHKIRLTATGTSGPNIDEMSLYFVSASSLDATSIPVTLSRGSLPNNKAADKLPEKSYKAYPNPFFQSTSIYYSVKQKSKVVLAVYNLQGQQIQLLKSAMQDAGNYQATFNADKFAKGIYLFRLQVGNEVKIGKLVKE